MIAFYFQVTFGLDKQSLLRRICRYTKSYVAPGPFLKLVVSASGLGMAPAIIDHIVEPFFTTKEVGSGDGIGLSVVYGIVRKSGGFIRVKNTVKSSRYSCPPLMQRN